MKTEEKTALIKNKKSTLSIVLFIGGAIVALLGIALLINNVKLYNDTVSQYVAQGYDASTVTASLMPSQLLPAVFEAIALYGGIAMILFCMGLINQKFANCKLQTTNDEINIIVPELNVTEIEAVEEIKEAIVSDTTAEKSTTVNEEAKENIK